MGNSPDKVSGCRAGEMLFIETRFQNSVWDGTPRCRVIQPIGFYKPYFGRLGHLVNGLEAGNLPLPRSLCAEGGNGLPGVRAIYQR